MDLNPSTMTLTVTCHALAMDQSKSSKGPIVFKLSSASTKTNPRGLKLSNSRGTFLSWRMELRETPKKSASASRKKPKEECRLCRTKLVIRYGRAAYISTENIFTISKRKEYSDKPEFRGLENKTLSQLCSELGFNVAKSDKLSDRICKPCGSRFKRQFPTTISPDRRPTSKAAKRSSGAKKSLAFRQEKENLTNVDAHLNVEGLPDKPTTPVKTIIVYPNGNVECRSSFSKESASIIINISKRNGKTVANTIFKHEEIKAELLGPITKAVDAEFTDYCKDLRKSILLAKTPAEVGRR